MAKTDVFWVYLLYKEYGVCLCILMSDMMSLTSASYSLDYMWDVVNELLCLCSVLVL